MILAARSGCSPAWPDPSGARAPRRSGPRRRRRGCVQLGGARQGRRARLGAVEPRRRGERPVSGRYVWDATTAGSRFAKKKTTLLRITGPKRGLYWRATTLDQFDADALAREPDAALDRLRRGDGCPTTRSCRRGPRTATPGCGRTSRCSARASPRSSPRRSRWRSTRRSSAPSSGSRTGSCRCRTASGGARPTRSTASRLDPARPSSRPCPRTTRRRSSAFSTSAARGSTPSARPAATGSSTALRGRALPRAVALRGDVGAGEAAAGRRAGRRTAPCRDRDVAARDRRLHLRRVAAGRRGRRRSRTSSPTASAATASTSPARWR